MVQLAFPQEVNLSRLSAFRRPIERRFWLRMMRAHTNNTKNDSAIESCDFDPEAEQPPSTMGLAQRRPVLVSSQRPLTHSSLLLQVWLATKQP